VPLWTVVRPLAVVACAALAAVVLNRRVGAIVRRPDTPLRSMCCWPSPGRHGWAPGSSRC
jgi:hypothetical protein